MFMDNNHVCELWELVAKHPQVARRVPKGGVAICCTHSDDARKAPAVGGAPGIRGDGRVLLDEGPKLIAPHTSPAHVVIENVR